MENMTTNILPKADENLSEADQEYLDALLSGTSKAIQLATKGRCWIEVNNEGARMAGADDVIEKLKGFVNLLEAEDTDEVNDKVRRKAIIDTMEYCGWEFEHHDDDSLTGEGTIAYVMFNWLMTDSCPKENMADDDEHRLYLNLLGDLKLMLGKDLKKNNA